MGQGTLFDVLLVPPTPMHVQFTAQMRSFNYYEVRALMLSSKAHEKVTKDLERCESQMEKKNAAVAKGGSNVEQAREQQAKATSAVNEASAAEERSRGEHIR